MSHHNGGPGPSPVKLEPKLEPIGNGHAVATTGNLLTTRQRLRLIPNKEHKPDGYEDLQLDFSPSIFSSLERYLPPSMLAVARDDKAKFMREILLKYLPTGERNRAQKHKEYRQKIIANYLPLHRELYTMDPTSFFVPAFLKAIHDNTEQSFKSITSEPSPGIFVFEIFQPSFCELLLAEIENFEKWVTGAKFRIMRPNTMNRYGAVLDDFGLETMLEKLMEGFIRPLARVFFAEVGGSTLDSHHGFVVEYGKDRDVDLGFHVDDSEVTLNVCLGKEFSGGELYFRGTRCEKHVNTGSQSEEIFDYSHVPGRAVLHRGRHRHGARATTSGHRVNLLLWCRSSVFREMKRYQTDFSSWCGECNRVKKESQRSTIAATKLFSPIAPSLLVPSNITSSKTKMGVHANSSRISAITWIIGSLIMVINIYYLMTSFINPLLHSHLEIGAKVFLGILGFSGMGVYLAGIAYLVLRKNRKATRLLALTAPERQQMANEKVNEHVINF